MSLDLRRRRLNGGRYASHSAKPQALGAPLLPFDRHEIVEKILASGRQLVIAVTGGGSGAISALVQTPGASRTVLEAVVPYSLAALVEWLGGKPDQACSEATARAMAMAAFMRARRLAPEVDPQLLVGVGFTGSLATDRPKRGERRIHLAAQTADRTEVHSAALTGNPPTREADESFSTDALLWLIARSCGVNVAEFNGQQNRGSQSRVEQAQAERTELLLGARRVAIVKPKTIGDHFADGEAPPIAIVFPGAFNPPHAGHLQMAVIAEKRLGRPVAWELSMANVDKPPLDFIAIRSRVEALRADDGDRLIALTHAPTFREKAELFPDATFVVGADTLLRIAEPRYYEGNEARRDAAVAKIAGRGCRFLGFGRTIDGRFKTLDDLALPLALRALCDEVPEDQFREDVSSMELRRQHDI